VRRSGGSVRHFSRRIGLVAGLAATAGACVDVAPTTAAPALVSADVGTTEPNLAVLPNNLTVHAVKNRLIGLQGGEAQWELPLPDGDSVIAPLAVALNSVTYVRGAKGIYAALPEGRWLWSKPLESRSLVKSRATDSPVSLSDSSVALVVGNEIVRFDNAGAVRWRFPVPDGHVTGKIVASMDGSLIAATTAGLIAVNPDGNVAWRRASP
jgi:outer membrane protein assembly factor BamB